jgi:hypothetical protein
VIDPRLASDLFPVVVERSLRFGFSDVLRFSDSFLIGLLLNALDECLEPHVLRATERDLVRVPLAIHPAGRCEGYVIEDSETTITPQAR